MTDRTYYGVILLCFLIFNILIVGVLTSINIKTDNVNKQLKTIVKLEERQNAKTPTETTTPELIIEENTLGGSNAK